MKKYIIVFLIPFFLTAADVVSAFNYQGNSESKIYKIGKFSDIFLDGSFKVQLIQGSDNYLEVQASDSDAFDYLNIRNEGGTLRINVRRKPFDFSKVTIYITFQTLRRLEIEGGIQLETKGYISLDDISMHLKGGGKINFLVKAEDMIIISEGGVLFHTEGICESLDVRMYGAGHIDAGELSAQNVQFRIEGVGTGFVNAKQSLNAIIKGAGKIKYRGNPDITRQIEGLGSVEKE